MYDKRKLETAFNTITSRVTECTILIVSLNEIAIDSINYDCYS